MADNWQNINIIVLSWTLDRWWVRDLWLIRDRLRRCENAYFPASGEWLPALFDRTVARPLRFGTYHWNLQGTGEGYLGRGVFVKPRDFLKIGQAYLDGGPWHGSRIADPAWVKDALSPHAHISPKTTGLSGEAFITNCYDVDEGWAWHMINVKSGSKTYRAFHANGNGGNSC